MNALLQKWTLLYNIGKLVKYIKEIAGRIRPVFQSEGIVNSKTLLQSKKSWALLVGIGSLFLTQFLGMPPENVDKIMAAIQVIVGSYFGAQTAQDIFATLKQPPVITSNPNEPDVK